MQDKDQGLQLETPVSRMIGGHLTELITKKKGKPIPENEHYRKLFLAMPKADPLTVKFVDSYKQYALQQFGHNPVAVQAINAGINGQPAKFSWKMYDGDVPDKDNELNENAAGCIVLCIESRFTFNCYEYVNGAYIKTDPSNYKRGDYFSVSVNLRPNGGTSGDGRDDYNAGMYVNCQGLLFVKTGEAILGAANPNQMFTSGIQTLQAGEQDVQLPQQPIPTGASLPHQQLPHQQLPQVGNGLSQQQPQQAAVIPNNSQNLPTSETTTYPSNVNPDYNF